MLKNLLRRTETPLLVSFLALILVGTIALSLPICHATDKVTWLDALFTATSAVCVTGLTTVDTAKDFSHVGRVVILALIQLGGLGVMTFSAVAVQLLGRRVSFGSLAMLSDAFFQGEAKGNLHRALRSILVITLTLEAIGALLIYTGLGATGVPHRTWFDAVFLSVSAFCNAGFSVYSDNAESFRASPLVQLTLMSLIVCGGLGYTVLIEIAQRVPRALARKRGRPVVWSLHSRIVLRFSFVLIVGGAVGLLITGLTTGLKGWSEHVLAATFQSVSSRTAGFNTIPIGQLPAPSLMILIPLMFIGGSPGSCAGGVKTTTAAVWASRIFSNASGRSGAVIRDRRIPSEVVQRATLVVGISLLWCGLGTFLLSISELVGERNRLEHVLFEQVSAFATVGLSTGITPSLSVFGKLWIIASMFVGRVGPLTIALTALATAGRPKFEYPQERVMIG